MRYSYKIEGLLRHGLNSNSFHTMNRLCSSGLLCCTGKRKHCCICRDTNKRVAIQCILCTDGTVCVNCVARLCENGLCKTCPVCRQEAWKPKAVVHAVKVVPVPLPPQDEGHLAYPGYPPTCCDILPPVRELLDRVSVIVAVGLASYVMGIITLWSFIPTLSMGTDVGLNLVAPVIGAIEIALICWCCRCVVCDSAEDMYT